jgi:CheY-like chemotaxis protein
VALTRRFVRRFGLPASTGLTGQGSATTKRAVAALDGTSVLVVDDEVDIVELLEFAITDAGATVRSATSGRAALELLPLWKPDVMLLDIDMPEMNGYELLSIIRHDPALEHVPAVAVTGSDRDRDKERTFAQGFSVHVMKPFNPDVLIDLIEWIATKARPRGRRDPRGRL